MKQKELIIELSNRLGESEQQMEELLAAFSGVVVDTLAERNSVLLQGFGVFEVKKKTERVFQTPDGKRYLVPPEFVPAFRPGSSLKKTIDKNNE